MANETQDFVVRIKADASDAINTLEQVDTKLEDTAQQASDLSGNLDKSSGLGAELANQATKMADSLSRGFDYASSMERAFANASAAVEPLGAALASEFEGISGKVSGFSTELSNVTTRLITSQNALESMGDKVRETMEGLGADAPRKTINELISLSNTVNKLNDAYERQSDKIIDIKLQLKDATNQLASLEDTQASIVADAQKELTMAESRLEEFKARARQNIADGFKPSAGIERAIGTLENRIQMIQSGIQGDHMSLPGYAEYAQQTDRLSAFIGQLQERLAGEEASMARVDRQAELYGARINALGVTQEQASATATKAESRFARLGTVLAGIGSRLASVASHAASFAKSLGKISLNGFRNIASMASKIGTAMKDWHKHTMNAGDAVKALHKRFTGFFRMMITRAKRMAISAIFKDISSNSGQIAQMSDSYNEAISGMVNSSKAFGAQLVAIMEPVISVVGPAISRIIDLLTTGADRLAQFTARLAGRDTYIKASKGVYDYASAVDSSTDSTKKAEKATKAFKASVMSFDELHKLEGSSDDVDASSITGITDGQLKKAATQATALNEVADKVREAWRRGDFGSVGKIAAMELGKAFDWLRNVAGWSANATKFSDMLSGVTSAVNGFVSGLKGETIGSAVADVANTVLNGFSILLSTIDGTAIGQQIGTMISSFAQDVDWTLAGQNLIAGFQFVVNMASGFLTTDALTQLGAGVASFFAGVAAEFDPAKWGAMLSGAVNGIASFFATAFTPETFAEMGTKLGETINSIFAGIKPEQLADGINAFVESLTSFINNAIGALDWSSIAQALGEVGSKLDWGSIFEIIGLAALPALIPAVIGLITKGLAAAAAAAIGGVPLLVGGVIAAVVAALVVNWDSVKEWAKGAWAAIEGWGEKIKGFFKGVVDGIVNGLRNIGEFFGGIGEGIGNGIKGAGAWIGEKATAVKNFFTGGDNSTETEIPETAISGTSLLTETSLACADAETILSRLDTSFNATIQQATNLILNALGQSGDVVLYVDSERLARATVRGLNTADLRQNATGGLSFV